MKLTLDELVPSACQDAQYMMKAEAILSIPQPSEGVTLVPRALVESTLSAINIALEKVQHHIDRTTPSAEQELEEAATLNAAVKAELGEDMEMPPNQPPTADQNTEMPPTQPPTADQDMEMPATAQEQITPKTELREEDMQMDDGPEGQEAHDDESNGARSKPTPKAKSGASKAAAKRRPRAKPAPKAKSKVCKKPAKNVKKVSKKANKGTSQETDDADTILKKKLHSATQLHVQYTKSDSSCVRSIYRYLIFRIALSFFLLATHSTHQSFHVQGIFLRLVNLCSPW